MKGDGGQMQQQVRGPAERRVQNHGVAHGGIGEHVARPEPELVHPQDRSGGAARRIQPDGVARGRQRGVRQRQPQRLAHHLRRGRRAQELASAAGTGAGPAAHVGGVVERDLLLGEAGADGLHLSCVLALVGQQRHSSGDHHGGQRTGRGQGHHHGGQSLVAGGHAQHALARRQGAHQAPQHHGCVVAVGQRIHHAGGALGAPVAGVGARAGKGHRVQRFQLARRLGHQQPHFKVPGVKAQRDGPAVFGAQAAVGAQDQELGIEEARRFPAHAGALGQPEEVAGGLIEEHFGGDGQLALGTGGMRAHVRQSAGRFENGLERNRSFSCTIHRASIGASAGCTVQAPLVRDRTWRHQPHFATGGSDSGPSSVSVNTCGLGTAVS